MKKGDFILIAVLAVFAAALFFIFPFKAGKTVTVKKDNKVIFSDSLLNDNTVDLGTNTVIIKSGTVYMKDASCKNQICVHTGKISKAGESIICLPNKIAVQIE